MSTERELVVAVSGKCTLLVPAAVQDVAARLHRARPTDHGEDTSGAGWCAECLGDAMTYVQVEREIGPEWRTDAAPRGVRCLVTSGDGDGGRRISVASISPESEHDVWYSDGRLLTKVVAWMPLPSRYAP